MSKALSASDIRRRTFLILSMTALGIVYSFFSPNYKDDIDWLPLSGEAYQKIGETNTEFFIRSTGDKILFPLKAFRASVLLSYFKLSYGFEDGEARKTLAPLRQGAFVLGIANTKNPAADYSVPFARSGVMFDFDGDGRPEKTSWVNNKAAILFMDRNNNNQLDMQSELLGVNDVSIWTSLVAMDTNGDGVFSQEDTAFSDIKLAWDSNGDQKVTGEDVFSFSKFVDRIDLKKIRHFDADLVKGGVRKVVRFQSGSYRYDPVQLFSWSVPVKMKDGMSRDLYVLYFDLNTKLGNKNPDPAQATKVKLSPLTPNLRGYGFYPDLHEVIKEDGTLKVMVENFVQRDARSILFDFEKTERDIEGILFRWASVDAIDPASRGMFFDARRLEYLEKMMTQRFAQKAYYLNPMPFAATSLKNAWGTAFNRQRALMVVQSLAGKKLMNGAYYYDPIKEEVLTGKGFSSEYLDEVAGLAQALSADDKRKLLQVITDVFDVVLDVYQHNPQGVFSTPPKKISKARKRFKERQLLILEEFKAKLFPQ